MTHDRILHGVLPLSFLTFAAIAVSGAWGQGHAPLGTGRISAPSELDRVAAFGPRFEPGPGPGVPARPGLDRALAYPLYRWPLDRVLGDGLVVVNYVDHDPSGGITDYMGGAHAYDAHGGIDYTLHNFRLMDRGTGVRAAASGTVAFIGGAAPGSFDRSCDFAWPDDGNWVWIAYGDGTYHEYYHLRAWSMTVGSAEAVQPGQLLGMVGSS